MGGGNLCLPKIQLKFRHVSTTITNGIFFYSSHIYDLSVSNLFVF